MSVVTMIASIKSDAKKRNVDQIVVEVWLNSGRVLVGDLGTWDTYYMQVKQNIGMCNETTWYVNYEHVEAIHAK